MKQAKSNFEGLQPLFELDVLQIMECIPNRYPFLLIDKVLVYPEAGGIGIKNVTINEPFFIGHFPHRPVMPGVLILEAIVQTSCVVACRSEGMSTKGAATYFTGVDHARFRKPVLPGDVLMIETHPKAQRGNLWKYQSVARVGGNVVAEAECSAMLIPHE